MRKGACAGHASGFGAVPAAFRNAAHPQLSLLCHLLFTPARAPFFICLTGRENRDIEFTALLPVRKTDLVRARVFTVMLMQLAQLVIAVPLLPCSAAVSPRKTLWAWTRTPRFFGIRAGAGTACSILSFSGNYRAPGKVGKAFGWGCGALTLCMVVFGGLRPHRPFVRDCPTRRTRRSWAKSSPYCRWRRTVRAAVGAGIAARHAQLLPRWTCGASLAFCSVKTSKGRVGKPCLSLSKKLRFYAPRHCAGRRGLF